MQCIVNGDDRYGATFIIHLDAIYRIQEIIIYSGYKNGTEGFLPKVNVTINEFFLNSYDVNEYKAIIRPENDIANQGYYPDSDRVDFNFPKGINKIYEIEIYGEYLRDEW